MESYDYMQWVYEDIMLMFAIGCILLVVVAPMMCYVTEALRWNLNPFKFDYNEEIGSNTTVSELLLKMEKHSLMEQWPTVVFYYKSLAGSVILFVVNLWIIRKNADIDGVYLVWEVVFIFVAVFTASVVEWYILWDLFEYVCVPIYRCARAKQKA